MVTKRKSEFSKARGDIRRATVRMVKALPMVRVNWRNVIMPWRLIPMPIAMALIALVALAMVLDNGDNVGASVGVGVLEEQRVMIGGDTVDPGTRCEEDEIIYYRVLMGGTGVGCVHYEYLVMDFLLECIVGNVDHGDNLASLHLRDPAFRSWCDTVIDDATDGVVSLGDLLFDTAYVPEVTPTITPTMTATIGVMPTMTSTPSLPKSLPSAGRH